MAVKGDTTTAHDRVSPRRRDLPAESSTAKRRRGLDPCLGALFVLAWAIPVWRKLGLPYVIVILVNMLPPLAAGGFLSAGRLSAVMFPVSICLASAVPARQRPAWTGSFMAIQALNAAFFYTWRELF